MFKPPSRIILYLSCIGLGCAAWLLKLYLHSELNAKRGGMDYGIQNAKYTFSSLVSFLPLSIYSQVPCSRAMALLRKGVLRENNQ